MTFYSQTSQKSTRNTFAREATLDAFGPRARWDLGEDREPPEGPRPIGKVAAQVTADVGRRALDHWLDQAAKASSEEERKAALEIAKEIAQLMDLDLGDLSKQRAA